MRPLVIRAARFITAIFRGENVRVPVAIVVGEGDLGANPHTALAGAQLRGNGGHRVLREAQRCGVHVTGKGLV